MRQYARLAAARTGEHEQRALAGLDGFPLFGVQAFQNVISLHVDWPPANPFRRLVE
jgi:hypothetical protein